MVRSGGGGEGLVREKLNVPTMFFTSKDACTCIVTTVFKCNIGNYRAKGRRGREGKEMRQGGRGAML